MKNYLLVFAIILIGTTFVSAQSKPKAKPSAKKVTVSAKPAAASVKASEPDDSSDAEKFDPLRDPNTDLEDAIARAQKSGKRIILDVGGEWCVWCHYLDSFFAKNPDLLKQRDDNFVWVKVNMSEENENKAFLGKYPQAPGYPHLYVLDTDGTFLQSQDTSVLELGKSYDISKVAQFIKTWAPTNATAAPAVVK
jgi:thiol:disulfide interchange protein